MEGKVICDLLELSDRLATAVDFVIENSREEFNLLSPLLGAKVSLAKLIAALEREKFCFFGDPEAKAEEAKAERILRMLLDSKNY